MNYNYQKNVKKSCFVIMSKMYFVFRVQREIKTHLDEIKNAFNPMYKWCTSASCSQNDQRKPVRWSQFYILALS